MTMHLDDDLRARAMVATGTTSKTAAIDLALRELDRRGAVLPLTGVLIARCARRMGAVALTFDNRCRSIPGVRAARQLAV